jgi:hypothetical protein
MLASYGSVKSMFVIASLAVSSVADSEVDKKADQIAPFHFGRADLFIDEPEKDYSFPSYEKLLGEGLGNIPLTGEIRLRGGAHDTRAKLAHTFHWDHRTFVKYHSKFQSGK